MMKNMPTVKLTKCITYATGTGLYIDPMMLLQYLDERAILLAERIAEPALDAVTTELLRGHRQEALALHTELKKVIQNARPTNY